MKCLGRDCGGKPAREKKPTRWNVVYTDTGAYLPMSLVSRVFSGEGVAFKGRFQVYAMAEFRQRKIKDPVASLLLLKTEDNGKQDTRPIAG